MPAEEEKPGRKLEMWRWAWKSRPAMGLIEFEAVRDPEVYFLLSQQQRLQGILARKRKRKCSKR